MGLPRRPAPLALKEPAGTPRTTHWVVWPGARAPFDDEDDDEGEDEDEEDDEDDWGVSSMSRYVMVKTQIRDLRLLRETLQGMGCAVQEGAQVRVAAGGRRADLVAQTPAGSVGFAQAGEEVRAVGMEELVRRDAFRQFLGQVTQQYARRKVMAEAERAGYRLVEEAVEADNTIRLVVRKW